jgi:hypothetical protein
MLVLTIASDFAGAKAEEPELSAMGHFRNVGGTSVEVEGANGREKEDVVVGTSRL